jgi:phosphatidylglycerol:prolipoprotein diacylglycerol transferase
MSRSTETKKRRFNIEPYWIAIAIFLLAAAILFINHQVSGDTPSRVAIHIEALNFDIYWYGVIIVVGIGLGAYVTARLALDKANQAFNKEVPKRLRREPISVLNLPDDIENQLRKRGYQTLGATIYQWGLNPQMLGLKTPQEELLVEQLKAQDGIDEQWLIDSPWRQWNPDYVWSGIVWVLIFAVVGARIYHILTPSPSMAEIGINSALDYFRSPLQLINLRSGGLGIYGGVIGGLLGLVLFAKRQRFSAIAWADVAVAGLALGQSIGRWGNFFNQELYGRPSDLPWAIKIDGLNRLTGYTQFEQFQPTFLYASFWSFLTFLILYRLGRKHSDRLYPGDLTAIYVLLFATGRILLELVRLDSRSFTIAGFDFGVPIATVLSIIFVLSMAILLLRRHFFSKSSSTAQFND